MTILINTTLIKINNARYLCRDVHQAATHMLSLNIPKIELEIADIDNWYLQDKAQQTFTLQLFNIHGSIIEVFYEARYYGYFNGINDRNVQFSLGKSSTKHGVSIQL